MTTVEKTKCILQMDNLTNIRESCCCCYYTSHTTRNESFTSTRNSYETIRQLQISPEYLFVLHSHYHTRHSFVLIEKTCEYKNVEVGDLIPFNI